ncbi:MAG TPA: sigma-70 family RNA polymerase sigma factor [Candidatus Paceibacterota bacterium]|nr:sigma-70 family RNA polymerase sigma factor [Candidatus Paceibacterota bacterium]HMO82675.1 sigma-70 family RNA polymerase sigma factor [Candidatus Paceibacterota bacterium]
MDDDSIYVNRCLSGETEAFGVLYDRYLDKIYRFVYYKTFNQETAEDITSSVFHKALEKISSYSESKGSFSSWLYQIARNSVIDHYRTHKNNLSLEDVFEVGVDERTPETLDALSALKTVQKYLETLDARQREILTLRIWEDKPYKEIAEILGGSEDSIKMAFSRGIRELREKCGPVSPLLLAIACSLETTLRFYDLS